MAVYTKEQLQELVKNKIGDDMLIIASNREPYQHILKEGKIVCQKPAGGVVSALDPVVRACGGVWVAYGNGNADRNTADREGKIQVPPDNPLYKLKRIWLTKPEVDGYYFGFSNEAIWPLCHIAYTRPAFEEGDWKQYQNVNKKFAQAILKELAGKDGVVWIQDYHLALLAGYIKEYRPHIKTSHFWHIPWPNPEAFRICPWKKEILEGLLANDLLGFHIRYHCFNFMDTVDRELEARVDREDMSVTYKGHKTLVRPYPISVDYHMLNEYSESDEIKAEAGRLKEEFGLVSIEKVIVGIDRIDYTKGIPERLRAIDKFLTKYPQYVKRIQFVQIGVISRIHIESYKALNDEINSLAEEINWKYSKDSWVPIQIVRRNLSTKQVVALFTIADACIVSSLHDGMNLVAKEYVSSRSDLGGALLVSRFTGASRELERGILINPYNTTDMAAKLKDALEMSDRERRSRMKKLRKTVEEKNVYAWASQIIKKLSEL